MAETTMAPAHLAPAERRTAVGWRFHPTDQELVSHFLRHKLKAEDLPIDETIPEIGVCKGEPWDLLEWAASASGGKFDESQCFFFSPRDYKYSNSNRSNRTTSCGFRKVTGRDRKITCKNTNKVIGTKKTLVFYRGRVPRAIKTHWIIHEYHDSELSHDQRTYVVCWLREDNKKKMEEKTRQLEKKTEGKTHQLEKKTQEKTHQLERRTCNRIILKHGNQTNSEEHTSSNTMIQVSSESNEESMNQISSQSNGIINPIQQIYPQSYEARSSVIEPPFELDEELASILHTPVHHYLNQILPQ
ncbi:hypothetical protein QN277_022191 [Acacia crassicarpa]|uniref:NAC domain-containing protein n=1 Tax=Acacia crassicarpa TaxID=499986 RepID=A0AAE1MLK4_9FABA|nr:hypothetical protein QN277_022191 [Acacia crassicarpa]